MYYRFHGAGAAGDLIQECTNYPSNSKNANLDYLTNDFWPSHNKLRNNVFDKFFTLEHTVHLAEGGEQLNRECSLFSECGRFVIVGSACYLPDEPHPPMHEIYRQVLFRKLLKLIIIVIALITIIFQKWTLMKCALSNFHRNPKQKDVWNPMIAFWNSPNVCFKSTFCVDKLVNFQKNI